MNYHQFNPNIVNESQEKVIKELLNTSSFDNHTRLLGFSKGRGITWFLQTDDIFGVNSVLRHYYRGGLFGKLIKESYFFTTLEKTRAMQEFNLLQQMSQWGLPVPQPIAVKINKKVCVYSADILIEKIENTQDLSQFLQKNTLSPQHYVEIGKLIKQLHQHQVHHSDLNIHNILFDELNNKFWLIDFDKCNIQQGEAWKSSNLERLLRSFNKEVERLNIHFNRSDWEILLKGYDL
ncbi:3-deoxy-D-manno-octulosonic acid kinase [Pasteurella skyensis]|uniref:3-deoxy-D-manno-octulosonic acid kinase n=1 Tax=Phocoenobacter skyensis TaxID=97481 RepID=A0AAJ6NBL8_9PAST|nr:3-deoxy-D-manno-octulosonic acid kinase [Pasteurella skyensis]MDP8163480.1 3-deoxy-D-manno-octulosonic acid kinase [Pasteurella skyensis]MDP8173795.1 3-deoxy-D-manno-octulosonic acid kinase [Pasteurella skyensis]MDP8177880.1 3-deoxy-D-manno-octulosonic acid kinase [Pasteurella skyensis]MDP8179944.1 3-deoxy-D-manno-octulosonic acid kinase [Pasteurella skyensis]MDP8184057.1 3-deoxy-D-manno-octulosonic acid kinase [Pasteurella skyensis]